MKNITVDLILVLTVIVVLSVFAIFVRVGVTADRVTVFRSCRIACAGCPEKLTRVLELEKGVASSKVDTGSGRVVVWYDSCLVRPEKLARSLIGAGFASSILTTMSPARYSEIAGEGPDIPVWIKEGAGRWCCRKN